MTTPSKLRRSSCGISTSSGYQRYYGHDNGDRYLREFAALKALEDYGGLIARRSGDEFLALVYGDDREQIEPLIAGINDTIEAMTVSLTTTRSRRCRHRTGRLVSGGRDGA